MWTGSIHKVKRLQEVLGFVVEIQLREQSQAFTWVGLGSLEVLGLSIRWFLWLSGCPTLT